MPRKIKSTGESTQQRRTSERRAMGASTGPRRTASTNPVQDGGKWTSGRKSVEHREGPSLVRQHQPGRGPKTRTATRSGKKNHPNHG
jgi:hypothetical protein